MKKTRIFALLCILVLLATMTGAASAGKKHMILTAPKTEAVSWKSYKTLKNGSNVSFVTFANTFSLYEKKGSVYQEYDDIVFDCKGKVSAKTSAEWINIYDDLKGPSIYINENESQKKRTGKVTFTGKNFKATITITQFGCDRIVSAVRKGNKVTVNLKLGDAPLHGLFIYASKGKKGENIFSGSNKKTTYTFKVKKGWTYDVGCGGGLKAKYSTGGSGETFIYDASFSFKVKKTTGEEKLYPRQ